MGKTGQHVSGVGPSVVRARSVEGSGDAELEQRGNRQRLRAAERGRPRLVPRTRPGSKRRSPSGLAATIAELPTGTVLAVVVALLCVIGLVMVGSASSVVSISLYGSPWAILIREGMWMAVGVHRVRRRRCASTTASSGGWPASAGRHLRLAPGRPGARPRGPRRRARADGSASASSACSPRS